MSKLTANDQLHLLFIYIQCAMWLYWVVFISNNLLCELFCSIETQYSHAHNYEYDNFCIEFCAPNTCIGISDTSNTTNIVVSFVVLYSI